MFFVRIKLKKKGRSLSDSEEEEQKHHSCRIRLEISCFDSYACFTETDDEISNGN